MDIKDTLDTLKDKAVDLAQAGVAQSKRLAEIARLKVANMSEEDTMKKAYLEIGRLYYAEQGAAPGGAYAAACQKITDAKAAIEANKAGKPFLVEAPMENIVVPTPGCWNINDIYSPNELVKEGKLVKKENGQYVAPSHSKSHNA